MNCHLAITRVKFVYLIDACVLRRKLIGVFIINEECVVRRARTCMLKKQTAICQIVLIPDFLQSKLWDNEFSYYGNKNNNLCNCQVLQRVSPCPTQLFNAVICQ